MWGLLDVGYQLLDTVAEFAELIETEIPSTYIRAFNLASLIDIPVGTTYGELLFGAGLMIIIGLKLIKFLLS